MSSKEQGGGNGIRRQEKLSNDNKINIEQQANGLTQGVNGNKLVKNGVGSNINGGQQKDF